MDHMTYKAAVIADSINPAGQRLPTVAVTIPWIVLSELNTHRAFARSSASSRAIPVHKQIRKVLENPFIPEEFGGHKAGMQSAPPDPQLHATSTDAWLEGRDQAVRAALGLLLGRALSMSDVALLYTRPSLTSAFIKEHGGPLVHKELVNRLLEPFMWHTALITATDWDNFFNLRCHPDAQPQIRRAAEAMRAALEDSTPTPVDWGEWHLPFVNMDDDIAGTPAVSAARSARVSYENHDGKRDLAKDVGLFDRLVKEPPHLSPLEHPAQAVEGRHANFTGWKQLRSWYEPVTSRAGASTATYGQTRTTAKRWLKRLSR